MIGIFLKHRRETLGLTQRMVVDILKLDSGGIQFLSNIERGISFPSAKVLKGLCKLYLLDYQENAELVISEIQKKSKLTLKKRYGI